MRTPTLLTLAVTAVVACDDRANETTPDAGTPDAPPAQLLCVAPESPLGWPEPHAVTITPDATWKTRVGRDDPFAVIDDPGTGDGMAWVKFTVLLDDPTRVYFQDSNRYRFHTDFARDKLDPFLGLPAAELDRLSLHRDGQRLVFGAVFLPLDGSVGEAGVQLVGLDAYHPEATARVVELVTGALDLPDGTRVLYMPIAEQQGCAAQQAGWLAARGVELAALDRWIAGNACYARGWGVGRLTRIAPGEIEDAFLDGRLRHTDILLTDAVPAELPLLAGVVSMAPSTPSSHVAILAQSYGAPFVYLRDAADRARAAALAGKTVALGAERDACRVRLVDLDAAPAGLVAEVLALRAPRPIAYPPKQPLGAYAVNTDDLAPADALHVGGKAAGYGVLRDAIPANASPAIALSFDLWDAFLEQRMASDLTLREEIAARLAGHGWPPDFAALDEDLAALRELIEDETDFAPDLRAAVIAALSPFDPDVKIRFRSSSNVEDGASFTGAGLYDSFSGCLTDDLDADEAGPSACEAEEPKERGVFRAIRKVYASFYNRNAYVERLRHGVDEREVGMALLVHHSYPDPIELANGVATTDLGVGYQLVSQVGATSITNPPPGVRPEVARLLSYGPYVQETSSLVPVGGRVLEDPAEYREMYDLLEAVSARWREVTGTASPLLDFEYKKVAPGGDLVIKQVRSPAAPRQHPGDRPVAGGRAAARVHLPGRGGGRLRQPPPEVALDPRRRCRAPRHRRCRELLP